LNALGFSVAGARGVDRASEHFQDFWKSEPGDNRPVLSLPCASVCKDLGKSDRIQNVSRRIFELSVIKDGTEEDFYFMRLALKEAGLAFSGGEVPVGAVLVADGDMIARAHNLREKLNDPSAHAEVNALREGARLIGSWRLNNAALYVTKEPCIMCAGAMVNARLGRLVYGCRDAKRGAVDSLYHVLADERLNHQVQVTSGILETECAEFLKTFFRQRR